MKKIIFACVHSAGRSQMAAAFFNKHLSSSSITAQAAGTDPAVQLHPEVVAVMLEVGIDLSAARPQLLTPELAAQATLMVTMGCGENCPFVPGLKIIDWALPDPKGKDLAVVRSIRDDIEQRVIELITQNNWK